jgi:hypothetical protein
MKQNIRTSLLEEAKSPTQYAEELASHWKRVSSALKKASYVLPDARNRLDGYDVLMQSYDVGDQSIVNLVAFPETEDLDVRIIRNPDIVPEAVFSKFMSKDKGKTWVRFQTRFRFDNADAIRRVAMAFQDRVFKAIEAFRDAEADGAKKTDPEKVTKTIKVVDKRPPKVVTGTKN